MSPIRIITGDSVPTIPSALPTGENPAPHVFILGSGASKAAFPNGDSNGACLPLMKELSEILNLNSLLTSEGIVPDTEDFETFYDSLVSSGSHQQIVELIEERVFDYFSHLELPNTPTLYDYLMLLLRPKDVIATFNWDPLLVLAYMRNSHLVELPHLLFLHGNVAISFCDNCQIKGYAGDKCKLCSRPYTPSRLLYPVSNKSYTDDPFISTEWDALRAYLRQAYFITIFGYSAPTTDAAARALMLSVWSTSQHRELAQFEIIDVRDAHELHLSWSEFIVREHYGIFQNLQDVYLFKYPRRSCEALASATLMLKPWPPTSVPAFDRLEALQEWISPLIAEEQAARRDGQPLSGNAKVGTT